MSKRDAARLTEKLTRLREDFQPKLEAYGGELSQLERSSEPNLVDLWRVQRRVERGRKEFQARLAQVWPRTYEPSLERPDLFRELTDLGSGFRQLLEAIASYEQQSFAAYFENFCDKLEPTVAGFDQELSRPQDPALDERSRRMDSLEYRSIRAMDYFIMVLVRATRLRWEPGRNFLVLEKRLERYPRLFERVNEVWLNLSRIKREVEGLKREIRMAQTKSSVAMPPLSGRSRNR
jgi:hypothetical protein